MLFSQFTETFLKCKFKKQKTYEITWSSV